MSERWLDGKIADGTIRAYTPAGSRTVLIDLNDLDRWVEAGER